MYCFVCLLTLYQDSWHWLFVIQEEGNQSISYDQATDPKHQRMPKNTIGTPPCTFRQLWHNVNSKDLKLRHTCYNTEKALQTYKNPVSDANKANTRVSQKCWIMVEAPHPPL